MDNGVRYHVVRMLEDYFWLEWDGLDIINMSFAQDSATYYTGGTTIDLRSKRKFDNRVISRNGPVESREMVRSNSHLLALWTTRWITFYGVTLSRSFMPTSRQR